MRERERERQRERERDREKANYYKSQNFVTCTSGHLGTSFPAFLPTLATLYTVLPET